MGEATGVPGGHEEYYYLNQGNADGRKTGDDGTTYRGVSWFGVYLMIIKANIYCLLQCVLMVLPNTKRNGVISLL